MGSIGRKGSSRLARTTLDAFPKFEGASSLGDRVSDDGQILVQQDQIRRVPGDFGRGIDTDPDVGDAQRARIVDSVADESDRVPTGP